MVTTIATPRVHVPVRLGSRPALTGLRAVAVLLVIAHHLDIYFLPQAAERSGTILPGAFVGVDVFFVLSGFLITTLLLEQSDRFGAVSYKRFWRDRLYRLVPALIPLLAALTLVLPVLGFATLGEMLYSDVVALGYAANWAAVVGHDVVPALGHCWSLAVEGQFYLLWPLAVMFALRRRLTTRTAVLLLIAGIVACAAWRAVLWAGSGVYFEVFPRTDARADALLIGALASVLWRSGTIPARILRPLACLSLLALLLVSLTVDLRDDVMYLGGYTGAALASAVLVLSLLDDDWWLGRALSNPAAIYLGTISYGVYLWHVPALMFFSKGSLELLPWPVGMACASVVTLAVAAASWRIVEQPALALRRRRSARAA